MIDIDLHACTQMICRFISLLRRSSSSFHPHVQSLSSFLAPLLISSSPRLCLLHYTLASTPQRHPRSSFVMPSENFQNAGYQRANALAKTQQPSASKSNPGIGTVHSSNHNEFFSSPPQPRPDKFPSPQATRTNCSASVECIKPPQPHHSTTS